MDDKVLQLVTPDFDDAPEYTERGPEARDTDMHFRFEINLIVDEITGSAPIIQILEDAWLEKRRYLRRFLFDYHASYKTLPDGLHDLGTTHIHRIPVGLVDFAQIRERIRERSDRKPRSKPFWAKWFE